MTKGHNQEIVENLDRYRIGLDDVFAFKCRECGKCCKNREDILLNSRDMYNIAKALSLTPDQVIEKYCETYIGNESRMPVVRLKPKGVNKVCPLLNGSKCSVHSLKPTVCALFPLGRVMSYGNAPEDLNLGPPNEIQFILTTTDCASRKRKQTVRKWLEDFNIPVEDHFFIEWNNLIFKLVTSIQKFEEKLNGMHRGHDLIWGGIYKALYLDYDAQKDFDSQFVSNSSKLLTIFTELERHI